MRLGCWILTWATSAMVMTGGAVHGQAQTPDNQKDYSFLNDLHGKQAMEWVQHQNHKTLSVLEKDHRFKGFYKNTLAALQAPDRVPLPQLQAGGVWNFWQDAHHPHGVWRATSYRSYLSQTPKWQSKLDIDALAAKEQINWVFEGAECLAPAAEHCLVQLSNAGEDAQTLREYNTQTGQFISGGFVFPRAKQQAAWVDDNTVLVARAWGNDGATLTSSGYPFVVKAVQRGKPLEQATEVYRGRPSDMMVAPLTFTDGDGQRLVLIQRNITFFETRYAVWDGAHLNWLALPPKSEVHGFAKGRLIVSVQDDWKPQGLPVVPAGSLVALDPKALEQGVEVIFTPDPSQALDQVGITKNTVLVTLLDNVRGRAMRFKPVQPGRPWSMEPLDVPDMSSVHIVAANPQSETAFLSVENYLTPQQLWLVEEQEQPKKIKAEAPRFKTSDLVMEQLWAKSADGTHIPYFAVHRKAMALTGANPTVLSAYGGFQLSYTPTYMPEVGQLWLQRGGVYVVANIRGGGEFGPQWHEAGRKAGRQKVYDDFAAVGQDLVQRHITNPQHLGIRGRSNGGLLAGVEMVQHPTQWNAVVIGVPLLDMENYETLSAGASWVAEYGSMSVPEEAEFLKKISPLRHLKPEVHYPVPFIFTATSDDRVGPLHARRFAAKMERFKKPFFYYEDTEGGHSGTVNAAEVAHERALEAVYLSQRLMDKH